MALDQVEHLLERRSSTLAAQANLSLQSVSLVLKAVTDRLAPGQIADAETFRRRVTALNIQQMLAQQSPAFRKSKRSASLTLTATSSIRRGPFLFDLTSPIATISSRSRTIPSSNGS